MKLHSIRCIGELWLQSLPTLPAWTTDYVARLVFSEDNNTIYVGGTIAYGDWIAVGTRFLDEGDKLDPETGESFHDRIYTLSVQNGNFVLTY